MKVNPSFSLTFDGRCEAAFKFYERCLGGKITFMLTWGDSPMAKDAPPEWGGKILHTTLTVGEIHLHGVDVVHGAYQAPRGFSILLGTGELGDAEKVFHALAENGTVRVPLQETFWALRFGSVTDQFGIQWEVNCEKPQ